MNASLGQELEEAGAQVGTRGYKGGVKLEGEHVFIGI